MSKKVESKSWNKFVHIFSGHGYSSTEQSVLYQKYKAGNIHNSLFFLFIYRFILLGYVFLTI